MRSSLHGLVQIILQINIGDFPLSVLKVLGKGGKIILPVMHVQRTQNVTRVYTHKKRNSDFPISKRSSKALEKRKSIMI